MKNSGNLSILKACAGRKWDGTGAGWDGSGTGAGWERDHIMGLRGGREAKIQSGTGL